MSNFIRKGSAGRVQAGRLYAFNETLKKETLRPRSYWEDNKDTHPINRWSYNRWKAQQDEDRMWDERYEKAPVDQKFKVKKLLKIANLSYLGPLLIIAYFLFSYVRHRWYGITPMDGGTAIARTIQCLPRLPGN